MPRKNIRFKPNNHCISVTKQGDTYNFLKLDHDTWKCTEPPTHFKFYSQANTPEQLLMDFQFEYQEFEINGFRGENNQPV